MTRIGRPPLHPALFKAERVPHSAKVVQARASLAIGGTLLRRPPHAATVVTPRMQAPSVLMRADPLRATLLRMRNAGTVQRSSDDSSGSDDAKERAPVAALYNAVSDYDSRMAFIAHWLWWEKKKLKVAPIAAEAGAVGLESDSSKHPDQTFFEQKLLKRPDPSAAIVTDCKLLPCVKKNNAGCAHQLPILIGKAFGAGIPIAHFGHAEGSNLTKLVYYTVSGASYSATNEALNHVYTWEWDSSYDPSTY
jgi:hypothetical protein